jgi:hypothetical protein
MKIANIILLCLISFSLSTNLKIQNQLSQIIKFTNLIKNGDFNTVQFPQDEVYVFAKIIENWETTDEIEVGYGQYYNKNYPTNKKMVEIDGKNNDAISQNIISDIDQDGILKFTYAAVKNRKDSSGLQVFLNGEKIFDETGKDYVLHFAEIKVRLGAGLNILTFQASGASDAYGMTFTDVQLLVEEASTNEVDDEC